MSNFLPFHRRCKLGNEGFTLIELLVVIAIIGLLASVVLASLGTAKVKARDAKRRIDLRELTKANAFYYDSNGVYADTAGWMTNWNSTNNALTPWISSLPTDPLAPSGRYQYWRKDYRGYPCMTVGTNQQAAFYALLENPSAADLATIADSFDQCVKDTWGLNYKVAN